MKVLVLASLFAIGVGTTFATTTDALQLISGGMTATIQDNGSCTGTGCTGLSGDINGTAGTDTITGSINGWDINIVSGTSHSPSLTPFGIDITSLAATCGAGTSGCASGLGGQLEILYSDINFNVPVTGFQTDYSVTITGGGNTSATESAYYNTVLFGRANLIGSVGPFSKTNAGTFGSSATPAANYSLTLDQVFTADIGGSSFSVDGNITGVPEPGAVVLFGTVLALCASRLRRRRAV